MLKFFHAPNTRSTRIRVLLTELDAPYELCLINTPAGEQRKSEFLAINPMGKVPAILDDGQLITETVAIVIYLADRFPAAGLAPAIGDPQRGAYLRWLIFYAACMEPAFVDRALHRESGQEFMSPYGNWDAVYKTVMGQLSKGPWFLGEKFTAADVVWGGSLQFMTDFKLFPRNDVVAAYLDRYGARPSVIAVKEKDAEPAARFATA